MEALLTPKNIRKTNSEPGPNQEVVINLSRGTKIVLFETIMFVQSKFNSFLHGITLSADTEYETDEKISEKTDWFVETSNKIIHLSETVEDTIEGFAKIKYILDYYFLNLTKKGKLNYNYKEEYLLTPLETANLLGVSKPTLLSTFVERGLEILSTSSHKKIPKHVLAYWKSPAWATKIQLLFQQYKQRKMTLEDKYYALLSEIQEFEDKYDNKKFEEVFAAVLNGEIDGDDLENADDYFEWNELCEEAQAYQRLLKE